LPISPLEVKADLLSRHPIVMFVALPIVARLRTRALRKREGPTGKSPKSLSTPSRKNIPLWSSGKSSLQIRAIPSQSEGRFANVTDAGRGAVDAEARLTGDANADGEDVWS
jgi:hypothetical protein